MDRTDIDNSPARAAQGNDGPRNGRAGGPLRWLRAFLVGLARDMPQGTVAARIIPWATAIVATITFIFGVVQFWQQGRDQRVGMVFELHARFHDHLQATRSFTLAIDKEPPADPLWALMTVCHLIAQQVGGLDCPDKSEAVDPRSLTPVVEARRALLDPPQRQVLEGRFNALQTTRYKRLPDLWRERLAFLNAVAVCARRNRCDPEASWAMFRGDILYFLGRTCDRIARDPGPVVRSYRELVDFVEAQRGVGLFARILMAMDSPFQPAPTPGMQVPEPCAWLRDHR